MPSVGLQRILELTISNILDISQLSSFKIAGNGPRTAVVLPFDECMAKACVSPIDTPKLLSSEAPNTGQKRQRKDEAT